jgi:hypothetical protein
VASSTPPDPDIAYQIEFSLDAGKTWQPIVRDWRIVRQGNEPRDFWSQSLCYGSEKVPEGDAREARLRFRNDGGKRYLRGEVHLEYEVPNREPLRVTYAWKDHAGEHQQTHVFVGDDPWQLATGTGVETHWVELEPAQP